jgi:hypothetical protein
MPDPIGSRELVIVARPEARLRATARGVESKAGADVSHLTRALHGAGAVMRPLFDADEDRLEHTHATMSAAGIAVPRLAHYYRVHVADDKLDSLAATLAGSPLLHAAYVKPRAEPAGLNDMQPKAGPAPATTPDFGARQAYLDPAPGGVDARFAWTLAGGRGAGVHIIDVELGWNFAHEDLLANQGGVVGGTPLTDNDSVNHGTATLGVFSGDGVGVTGICRDASVSAIASANAATSAAAIHSAADRLSAGDIILIEMHRAGPRANTPGYTQQQGYLPLEWWPDDYDAIRYANAKGVIVIEAAGNGGENLDDPFYNAPAAGFPATWTNPFPRGARDSGAILVGAGTPPPNVHGTGWGWDRSRLDFSNYGSALDVQGWGREVTTTGYGDLQGGASVNTWYTDHFAGTSSAAAIVAGVVGCAQGAMRASGAPLTPAHTRALLRASGSPQQDGTYPATQRIGSRPDLRQILGALGMETDTPVPLHRYWSAQIPDHFYTTNFAELGAGTAAYVYEGVACRVHQQNIAGTVPLYRYWNSQLGDHFFTTDYSEIGAGKYGWVFEGPACYVHVQPIAGTIPLYRYWNSNGRDHYFTTDWNELGNGKNGWVFEKIQCYVHA